MTELSPPSPQLDVLDDDQVVALVVLDRDLVCLQARQLAADFACPIETGVAAEGVAMRSLVDGDVYAALRPQLERALGGRPTAFDLRTPPTDAPYHMLCTPLHDADGEVDGVQVLLLDASARWDRERQSAWRRHQFAEAERLGHLGHWHRDLRRNELKGSGGLDRILGLPAGTPVPFDEYIRMIHPEDRDRARHTRDLAFVAKRGYDYAYRVVRPSGEVRWVEGVTEPILDQDDEISGFFGVMLDVTERRQVETELKLRERQLEEAQRLGRICHWRWDVASDKFEASSELYRMYGLAPGSKLDLQSVTDPIHPDDREWARENRERARRERRGYDFAFRLVRADGEVRWLEGRTEPMFDAHGEVSGYFGVTQDMTELKQAERANARYLSAIQQLKEGIALYDENDRLVVSNVAYRKVPGHGEIELEPGIAFEEVARRRREAAFGPEDPEKLDAYLAERMVRRRKPLGPQVFRFGESWQHVSEERLADGSTVMVVTEITQQKKYEEQERQARHAEALGRVVGGIAHEFNNLLTVINASLELVQLKVAGNEKLESVITRASGALRRGVGLSRRMLAYGRQQFLRPVDLDLNVFMQAQLGDIEAMMGERIATDVQLTAGLGLCRADPEALREALTNLLENSRDAMPHGGRLTIRTVDVKRTPMEEGETVGPRDYVMIEVCDTGGGIDAVALDRVCDPFFTTKDVGEGTGLGLSMVQGFVHQSGGEMEIDSTLGKGTTVRFYLPRPEGRDPMSRHDAKSDSTTA